MAGRPGNREKILGPLESRIMDVLWQTARPMVVREVVEQLNRGSGEPLAYTTVMTVMSRLAEKGVLDRRREGRGYLYEAMAKDPAGIAVRGVLRDFGDAAMTHFIAEARADPDAMARLQRLLADES